MSEGCATSNRDDEEIAAYEVSEDGTTWRPFDPSRDDGQLLHTRIIFAPPTED
jgi:hypothetical protein